MILLTYLLIGHFSDDTLQAIAFTGTYRRKSTAKKSNKLTTQITFNKPPSQHIWPFSVAGPTVWNSLHEDLQDPECSAEIFRQSLKTFLFSQH